MCLLFCVLGSVLCVSLNVDIVLITAHLTIEEQYNPVNHNNGTNVIWVLDQRIYFCPWCYERGPVSQATVCELSVSGYCKYNPWQMRYTRSPK